MDIGAGITTGTTELREATKMERIGVHSHITGLGLDDRLEPRPISQGMVGQMRARKAAGVILRMLSPSSFSSSSTVSAAAPGLSGRAILLAGPPSTGKTAIARGMAATLGPDVPFTSITASEVYSLSMSKTEALTQALRRSIGVRIREEEEVVEGEVVEIVVERGITGSGKSGRVILKTTDMETVYEMGGKMIDEMTKEKVLAGDIISITKSSGRITKLGRSFSHSRDFSLLSPSTTFIPTPSGEILTRRTVTHTVSLHEIDIINSRTQGFLALFAGDTGEVAAPLRAQIDVKVGEWREEGKAELVTGVLFIDEVHMLDMECFSFLNRALEGELAPLVVMASNRGVARIRGTEMRGPHGLPPDLLDRLLIVATSKYNPDEVREIIKIRCQEEDVEVGPEAEDLLVEIAGDAGMRYALGLIAVSQVVARKRVKFSGGGSEAVEVEDLRRAYGCFMDPGRSVQWLKEQQGSLLVEEIGAGGNGFLEHNTDKMDVV
ncbi:TIP49-domain-containing protein [Lentinula raphanica]|uniref:RuvB-like helicase n=1 Tax=Lentinula raphanica TaxID=153919 RepID=A0AA38UC63_9AGAR|nr:TIP49-domain-containing protein [Lentinula raphanica]KAJ3820442.1 TIP49-domain-containing protein [Lentinula raphanica]KAJ3836937.1 TIP49-domain-containing protein [Lentinula raphanica]